MTQNELNQIIGYSMYKQAAGTPWQGDAIHDFNSTSGIPAPIGKAMNAMFSFKNPFSSPPRPEALNTLGGLPKSPQFNWQEYLNQSHTPNGPGSYDISPKPKGYTARPGVAATSDTPTDTEKAFEEAAGLNSSSPQGAGQATSPNHPTFTNPWGPNDSWGPYTIGIHPSMRDGRNPFDVPDWLQKHWDNMPFNEQLRRAMQPGLLYKPMPEFSPSNLGFGSKFDSVGNIRDAMNAHPVVKGYEAVGGSLKQFGKNVYRRATDMYDNAIKPIGQRIGNMFNR